MEIENTIHFEVDLKTFMEIHDNKEIRDSPYLRQSREKYKKFIKSISERFKSNVEYCFPFKFYVGVFNFTGEQTKFEMKTNSFAQNFKLSNEQLEELFEKALIETVQYLPRYEELERRALQKNDS